jgi:hypothetical protein
MTRTKLVNLICLLPVYNLAQKNGTCPSLGPSMCLLRDGHLILRGILNLFFRNKYSGQVMSKNKKIISCHATKQSEIQHI